VLNQKKAMLYNISHGFPQLLNSFPFTLVVTFNLALGSYLFGKAKSNKSVYAAICIHLLYFPLCWSRSAFLGLAMSLVIQFTFAAVRGFRENRSKMATIACTICILAPLTEFTIGTTLGQRLRENQKDSMITSASEKRPKLAKEGMGRAMSNPLFGEHFTPSYERPVFQQVRPPVALSQSAKAAQSKAIKEKVKVKRLFSSHNQYVDLLLRGGIPFCLMVVVFFTRSLWSSYRLSRHPAGEGQPLHAVIAIAAFSCIPVVAVCCNFQLYLIHILTASPLFLLMGLMYKSETLAAESSETSSRDTTPFPHPVERESAKTAA